MRSCKSTDKDTLLAYIYIALIMKQLAIKENESS